MLRRAGEFSVLIRFKEEWSQKKVVSMTNHGSTVGGWMRQPTKQAAARLLGADW
ncbi:MAG: hypothetical protein ABR555_06190 [Pyrinomonadaceae bacterium]